MAHIFIIAGHGDGDPGASGNGYKEYERVRALAKKIKAYGGDNVTVGDTSRDWYKDNLISSLNISKDWQIIELHMDGASASSARGGHVIINSTYDPDKYDKALAEFISDILPGRSSTIVKRSDLANPKRAAAKGYPYRLLECGFITNAQDVKIFNGQMDDIAKGILGAFGIKVSGSAAGTSKPAESKPAASTSKPAASTSKAEQIKVDGWWGKDTTKRLQRIFKTPVDEIVSNQDPAQKKYLLRADSGSWDFKGTGNGSDLIGAMQRYVGEKDDGFMGKKTIMAWQKKLGVTVDGYMGENTVKKLQQWINKQK